MIERTATYRSAMQGGQGTHDSPRRPLEARQALARAPHAADVRRHYRDGGLLLETRIESEDGKMSIVDFLPTTDNRIEATAAEEWVV